MLNTVAHVRPFHEPGGSERESAPSLIGEKFELTHARCYGLRIYGKDPE